MRLTMAAVCLAVLCLSVVLPALAAGEGAVAAPVGPILLAMPDLVVKQVDVSRGGGEFRLYTFRITVANIGNRAAAATKTGIVSYALVRTDQPMATGLLGEVATPAIAAGAQRVVTFTYNVGLAKMYLFVTADFPDTAHQLGAIGEKSEGNNVLVVPLDTEASFPRTYK
jgi:hypothetical protein